MRITRIYANNLLNPGKENRLSLDSEPSHRLKRVLRLKPGSLLHIFNGAGKEFSAQLLEYQGNTAHIQLLKPVQNHSESPLHTTLWLGISRGERMDYAIQKSVELGIHCIQPLFTRYCEVKLSGTRLEKRLQHWQGIIINACEQSGRNIVPELKIPTLITETQHFKNGNCRLILLPDATDTLKNITLSKSKPITLLVGPEGGLSDDEIAWAKANQFTPIRLGRRILRTETAPVATLATLQALAGDFC